MSEHSIAGKKVAFLLTDGVEQVELTSPWQAVKDAGGEPVLVAPGSGRLQGYNGTDKGDTFNVDSRWRRPMRPTSTLWSSPAA